jgi:hypothetical protein
MKIEVNPKEPMHIRVRYEGKVIHDEVLQPGPHAIEVDHPKTCGKAELFLVEDDDSEFPIGSADYGPCTCAAGTHCS